MGCRIPWLGTSAEEAGCGQPLGATTHHVPLVQQGLQEVTLPSPVRRAGLVDNGPQALHQHQHLRRTRVLHGHLERDVPA